MRKIGVTLLILSVVLLSGCWDMREITDLGLVMAVGIDKNADSNQYTVTVQMANPNQGGGSQAGKGGPTQAVWVSSAEGKTIFEAIRKLVKVSSKRIMWAHNNIVIIGESLAKDSIIPVLDFFTHNSELRMKTWVAVSEGNAKDYITAKSSIDAIPGIALQQMFRYGPLAAESLQTDMLSLSTQFYSNETQPILSAITFQKHLMTSDKGKSNDEAQPVFLEGAAVFNKDKMVGWLSPQETLGVAWILDQTQDTIVTVPEPTNRNKSVAVETSNVKTIIKSQLKEGMPNVTIKVTAEGSIVEEDGTTNLSITAFKNKIETLVAQKISTDIRMAVDKVQKGYKSDVLRFGREIHIQHDKEWESEIKYKWHSIFPNIPVKIEAHIDIIDSKLNQEPMKPLEKKGDQIE